MSSPEITWLSVAYTWSPFTTVRGVPLGTPVFVGPGLVLEGGGTVDDVGVGDGLDVVGVGVEGADVVGVGVEGADVVGAGVVGAEVLGAGLEGFELVVGVGGGVVIGVVPGWNRAST